MVAALVHCFPNIGFPRAVAAIRAVRVIIGPWTHTDFSGSFPDRGFGPTANAAAIDLPGIQLRWFDRWLCGADNGIDAEPQ